MLAVHDNQCEFLIDIMSASSIIRKIVRKPIIAINAPKASRGQVVSLAYFLKNFV